MEFFEIDAAASLIWHSSDQDRFGDKFWTPSLKSETTKKFQAYYVPAVYEKEAQQVQGELSSFDIEVLNKTLVGNTGYKRKTVTRDR